jgi:hypothetical protein
VMFGLRDDFHGLGHSIAESVPRAPPCAYILHTRPNAESASNRVAIVYANRTSSFGTKRPQVQILSPRLNKAA